MFGIQIWLESIVNRSGDILEFTDLKNGFCREFGVDRSGESLELTDLGRMLS